MPYGLTFHVGSQALDPAAYARRHRAVGRRHARRSRAAGLRLELLDIGGGLPARYTEPIPPTRGVRAAIAEALARLPYPVEVVAEPGRALVAEAGVLATTVIGVAERAGRRWVHLDVGAFNGMMETLETRRELIFPLAWSSRGPRRLVPCAVTGPTCDSEDTLFLDVSLPDDLGPGRSALHRDGRRIHDGVRVAFQRLRRAAHTRCDIAGGGARPAGSRDTCATRARVCDNRGRRADLMCE